ncbi:MAG: iron(III) transport system ATP-binding protein [bacterium]
MKVSHHILECKSVVKKFKNTVAVNGLNLELHHQEFLALLGPSGCGKSTTLRALAGFESIEGGEIILNNRQVTTPQKLVKPENRNIGMVFQDYALFPHLSVFKNVAFGLTGSRQEKKERVQEMLELVELEDQAEKMPHMLSGGQQQRVALARALAPAPKVIFLDEPFSNLDYKLRVQLRQDVHRILKKAEVSVILVTHDQAEAFSFADRIAMMEQGKIVQIGSPIEIYQKPVNPWVASFVGSANFVNATAQNGVLNSIIGEVSENIASLDSKVKDYQLMIRPENLIVCKENGSSNGKIEGIEFMGDREILDVRLNSGELVQASVQPYQSWSRGSNVDVSASRCTVFPV